MLYINFNLPNVRLRVAARHSKYINSFLLFIGLNQELYFDERKDKSMVNHKEGTKYYRKIITEDQISLIQEPGFKYIGHATPTN